MSQFSRTLIVSAVLLGLTTVRAGVRGAETGRLASGWRSSSAYASAHASILTDDLYTHASLLADDTLEGRNAGSRGGAAASRYLIKLLTEWGVEPAAVDDYTQYFSGQYRNVLARMEGDDPELKDEVIVVGAHFDHVGYGTPRNSYGPLGYIHNGADDNASGVAVLLEVIQAMSEFKLRTRRTVLFAFWDAEEQGLLGSWHWVRQPTVELHRVRMSVNIDMVGRLRDGRIEIGGSRTGYGMRRLAATRSLPSGLWHDFNWEIKENSDHWPFIQRQIPTLMLHTGLHDDYHRPSDDIEKLNIDGMRLVAQHLLDLVLAAADAEELPAYRSAGLRESPFARKRLEQPARPLPTRLGITYREVPPDVADPSADPTEAPAETVPSSTAEGRGILVTAVHPDSPAALAGIQVDDQIHAVGDQAVVSLASFAQAVMRAPAATVLKIHRAGAEDHEMVDVNLAGRPSRLGISWRRDEAEPQAVFLTRVTPYSPAAEAGLVIRDRIYEVNGERFASMREFGERIQTALESENSELRLLVETRGGLRDVVVKISPAAATPSNGVTTTEPE